MIEGTRRPQSVQYSFIAITVSISRTCLSSLLKCWHHELGTLCCFRNLQGKIWQATSQPFIEFPDVFRLLFFIQGNRIFLGFRMCVAEMTSLRATCPSEPRVNVLGQALYNSRVCVCLVLHGFGGTGDRVTDEVMFCFQSAGRKERNKDQNSEPRKRKGWRVTWVVCDVPKRQKTKLEHSVGKNTTGRLIFKEIHTEPHSPTNYSKNSIPREQQTKLSVFL